MFTFCSYHAVRRERKCRLVSTAIHSLTAHIRLGPYPLTTG
jgi:hypothetical protein